MAQVEHMSLPEIAQAYELKRGRNNLIQFLLTQLAESGRAPLPVHKQIAALPVRTIITTAWDDGLATALAGQVVYQVVDDSDIPYVGSEGKTLIKLHGSLDRKQSLVLTDDDQDALAVTQPETVNLVRQAFASRTILFLGYDLAGNDFKHLYREVVRRLGKHKRRAYAVQADVLAHVERYWLGKNVETIPAEVGSFLDSLINKDNLEQISPQPIQRQPEAKPAGVGQGLHPDTLRNLRQILANCGPFHQEDALRHVFLDTRITAWRDSIPESNRVDVRINTVIEHLLLRYNAQGENVLVLFILALRDRTDIQDACYGKLSRLAEEMRQELGLLS